MSDNRDYKKEFKELAKDNLVLNTQNAILKYENDNLKEQLKLCGVGVRSEQLKDNRLAYSLGYNDGATKTAEILGII